MKDIGGQAVMEGVMIRAGDRIATAVREADKIVVKEEEYISLSKRYRFLGIPFLRGAVALFEMLYIGMKSLMWSANQGEDDAELKSWQIMLTVAGGIVFALALFKLLPYVLTNLVGFREVNEPIIFNLIDGAIKVGIFLVYLLIISKMEDIARVFQYHGAEHKAVNAYETGKELTPEYASGFSTVHPRCGTNFILNVFLIGVLVFSIIPLIAKGLFPGFSELGWQTKGALLFGLRILMLPVIAGISYEWLKLSSRLNSRVFRLLNAPGLWLQNITTNEPTLEQLEVSCAAVHAATKENKI